MNVNPVFDAARSALKARIEEAFKEAGVGMEGVLVEVEPAIQNQYSSNHFKEGDELKVTLVSSLADRRTFKKLKSGNFNFSGMVEHIRKARQEKEDEAKRAQIAAESRQKTFDLRDRVIRETVPADKVGNGWRGEVNLNSRKVQLGIDNYGGLEMTVKGLSEEQAKAFLKLALDLGVL